MANETFYGHGLSKNCMGLKNLHQETDLGWEILRDDQNNIEFPSVKWREGSDGEIKFHPSLNIL